MARDRTDSRRSPVPPATPPAESGDAERLGDQGRTVATVAIGFVLLGLAFGIAAHSASGASALVRVITGRLFSPLLVPPWLAVGHDTRLTYGLPEDADHHVEVSPRGAGDRAVRLPAAGDRSGRASRWRRLARAAALAEEEGGDRAGTLAIAVGAGMPALVGADDVVVRFGRVVPPEYGFPATAATAETVHTGRARRLGDEIQWIPAPAAEELAPLVPGGAEAER